jgi:hypothetical protein
MKGDAGGAPPLNSDWVCELGQDQVAARRARAGPSRCQFGWYLELCECHEVCVMPAAGQKQLPSSELTDTCSCPAVAAVHLQAVSCLSLPEPAPKNQFTSVVAFHECEAVLTVRGEYRLKGESSMAACATPWRKCGGTWCCIKGMCGHPGC